MINNIRDLPKVIVRPLYLTSLNFIFWILPPATANIEIIVCVYTIHTHTNRYST